MRIDDCRMAGGAVIGKRLPTPFWWPI